MSTAALPLAALDRDDAVSAGLPRLHVYVTALVVGLAFFVTEHDLSISLADAYTQTAEEMELTAGGGDLVRRFSFLALGGLGLWLLAIGRQPLSLNAWLAAPLAAFLLLAVASLLWSVDRGLCVRRLIVVGCCTLAAAGIARRFSMRELCQLALAIIGPLVVIGVLSELRLGTFRPWSGDYRFSGSVHPNTQGMYLTALALATLGLVRSQARWRTSLWSLFAACLVLMLLTKSRTGNASTLAAIAAVFLVQTPLKLKLTAGFAALWAGLAGLWLLMVVGYDPLTDFQGALLLGRAEESDTLSGRAFIWPLVTYFIGQRPWLGYGFESFWNASNIELVSEELTWGVREAHNGYLDVLLSTGTIGLMLVVLVVLAGIVVAAKSSLRSRDPAYALPLGMLVFGLLSSWMESGMVNVMLPPMLVGCCLLRMALFEKPVGCMSETKCTLPSNDDSRVHFATAHALSRNRR